MDDVARLQLARRAWHATAPTEQQISAGVKRAERSICAGGRRRSSTRRVVSLVLATLVLGAALAYAAQAVLHRVPPSSPKLPQGVGARTPFPTSEPAAPPGGPQTRPRHRLGTPPRSTPDTIQHATSSPPRTSPLALGQVPKPGGAAPAPAHQSSPTKNADAPGGSATASGPAHAVAESDPSWQAVDEALVAGDDTRAERILHALSSSGDVATRAKAKLGLAQLAARQGDCEKVRSLVLELTLTPDVPRPLVRRARHLAVQCR
jgi:hypothetical protein